VWRVGLGTPDEHMRANSILTGDLAAIEINVALPFKPEQVASPSARIIVNGG